MADKGKKEPKATTPQKECGCGCLPAKKKKQLRGAKGGEESRAPSVPPSCYLTNVK